ncbi:MAG: bis(5'-nucleosyl)-tetraphosphatase (symmetrical) YqeK [Clostridia bacterium]|nr:bis(5'-nucleosyl)-tetraphosphatase (symmetrical) YqeK [Clostridia bacterium]
MTLDALKKRMEDTLPAKRFSHVLAVVETAEELANIYGADKELLSVASLLHDCTKPFTSEEHIAYAKKHSYQLSPDDLASPEVLHARTGAIMAKEELGQADRVFSLIYCHCTAKPDMTLEEKLLFLSDFIEATRTHKICQDTRREFFSSLKGHNDKMKLLDQTVLRVLKSTVEHLNEKNTYIHTDTLRAIEFLKSED